MKPRHAAALTLVGWYLVLPPKEGLIVKPAAPMRDWKIEQSFVQFLGRPPTEKTEAIAIEEPAPPAKEAPF